MSTPISELIREAVAAGAAFDACEDGRVTVRDMRTLPAALRCRLRARKDELRAHLSVAGAGPSASLLARLGVRVRRVGDPEEARKAVGDIVAAARRLGPDGRVGFDVETTPKLQYRELQPTIRLTRSGKPIEDGPGDRAGLDPNRADIRLAQFYPGGGTAYVLDLRCVPFCALQPLLELSLVAHNAVFETGFLLGAGVAPDRLSRVDCTMLAANVLFGGLPSLADLAAAQLGLRVDKTQQVSDWGAPELTPEQVAYAAADAVIAHLLAGRLLPRLGSRRPTYQAMVEAQPCVAWMHIRGIHLDLEEHARLREGWVADRDAAAAEVAELMPGVDPNSPAQLAGWLKRTLPSHQIASWPRTETGRLSTAASDLGVIGEHPAVRALLRLRELGKLLGTYGASLAGHVSAATGRVHADYRLGGAKTGRLSCRDPNIQNQPAGKGGGPSLRPVWAAPRGRVLVGGDWNQMELRAAAIISGDLTMQREFRHGADLHRFTAAAVSGKPVEAIAKDGPERAFAKALNFGLLYGMGAARFREYAAADYGVAMSEAEAVRARDKFFATYHGLRRWQRIQVGRPKRRGYAETRMGRRVEWAREGEFKYTLALNTPVQGSCAEALLVALARLPAVLAGLDAFPVACVHDEILLEAAQPDAARAVELLGQVMTDAFCEVFPESPRSGLVEVKVGRNWAEAK